MAQLMDLSNDSPRLKLSPFEVQMRRRLWWTICRLDLRTAEAYGLQPSLLETRSRDTLPLNVNDLDLYPEAIEALAPRTGITDMTLPLVGYEITRLVSTINIPDSYDMGADGADARMNQAIARKMRMVGECQSRLQSDYLQYANPSGPFDWMTTTFTRLMLVSHSSGRRPILWTDILISVDEMHPFDISSAQRCSNASFDAGSQRPALLGFY